MGINRGKRYLLFMTAGLMAVAALFAADILCGEIPLKNIIEDGMARDIIMGVRLPRAVTAALAGAALAYSGTQMQAVFRNPLADPHIMGVSGGAGTGAAIATMAMTGHAAAWGGMAVATAAFIGAAAASMLILAVSARTRNGATLLLFGVMLGFIFSAVTSIIEYSASENSLKVFYSWSAGSFSITGPDQALMLAMAAVAGFIPAVLNTRGLDLILFGDEYAEISGSSVRRTRLLAMTSCCLATGAVTAFCGPIGFVGIVAPHISRWLTGTSLHRKILPASLVTGMAICLASDILSHAGGLLLPASSMTALIGIPVILLILLKNDHKR